MGLRWVWVEPPPPPSPPQLPAAATNPLASSSTNTGYRYYHLHNEQPRFWFGDGLSYADFKLDTDSLAWQKDDKVTATVTNAGAVAGAVVPQLYLALPKACEQPMYAGH